MLWHHWLGDRKGTYVVVVVVYWLFVNDRITDDQMHCMELWCDRLPFPEASDTLQKYQVHSLCIGFCRFYTARIFSELSIIEIFPPSFPFSVHLVCWVLGLLSLWNITDVTVVLSFSSDPLSEGWLHNEQCVSIVDVLPFVLLWAQFQDRPRFNDLFSRTSWVSRHQEG